VGGCAASTLEFQVFVFKGNVAYARFLLNTLNTGGIHQIADEAVIRQVLSA